MNNYENYTGSEPHKEIPQNIIVETHIINFIMTLANTWHMHGRWYTSHLHVVTSDV